MNHNVFDEATPMFYGSTTIGERGQIVIPADARKDLDLSPATKVLVFRTGPFAEGILILKADSVARMMSQASKMLNGMKEHLDQDETGDQ